MDIIEGRVNPSGKLPVTFPNVPNEQNMTVEQFPGVNNISHYSEGLFMGYRWYDKHNVNPAFPFGHGLTYTQFKYEAESLRIDDMISATKDHAKKKVRILVQNTGSKPGKEVVQLYLGFPEGSQEPPKILKGFSKIELKPQEKKFVEFILREQDMSVWDVQDHRWQQQQGTFKVFIGSSSRDIRA